MNNYFKKISIDWEKLPIDYNRQFSKILNVPCYRTTDRDKDIIPAFWEAFQKEFPELCKIKNSQGVFYNAFRGGLMRLFDNSELEFHKTKDPYSQQFELSFFDCKLGLAHTLNYPEIHTSINCIEDGLLIYNFFDNLLEPSIYKANILYFITKQMSDLENKQKFVA